MWGLRGGVRRGHVCLPGCQAGGLALAVWSPVGRWATATGTCEGGGQAQPEACPVGTTRAPFVAIMGTCDGGWQAVVCYPCWQARVCPRVGTHRSAARWALAMCTPALVGGLRNGCCRAGPVHPYIWLTLTTTTVTHTYSPCMGAPRDLCVDSRCCACSSPPGLHRSYAVLSNPLTRTFDQRP